MKTYAFVFARGGSKGIPDKNIRTLDGKPLLAWSIEIAKTIPEINRVFVSTDNTRIAKIACEWEADVIDRPSELAQDDTPEWLAWHHAVEWVQDQYGNFDRFVSLPTTSPLRNKDDILNCLNRLDKNTDIVITITETSRSPWFNMVQVASDESLKLLIQGSYFRRQDVPEIFGMTTVAYVTRPSFILNNQRIWDGRVSGVTIPAERALDIDTRFDLELAELILSKYVHREK